MNKEKFIRCECRSLDHLIHFQYFDDEDWPELFLSVHLCNYGFFKRLWVGLRYAFGYKSRFGHWDEVVLWRDKVEELRGFINQFLKDTKGKNV